MLFLQNILAGCENNITENANENDATYFKDDLRPFTNYSVSIYTVNSGGPSKENNTIIRTEEGGNVSVYKYDTSLL